MPVVRQMLVLVLAIPSERENQREIGKTGYRSVSTTNFSSQKLEPLSRGWIAGDFG